MIAVVSNACSLRALTDLVNDWGAASLVLGLWSEGPLAPNRDTTLADLTECSFVGYSRISGSAWGSPFIDSANKARSDFAGIALWKFTAGVGSTVVKGWFLLDDGTGDLQLCGRLDTPQTLDPDHNVLLVEPSVTMVTEVG